MAGFLRGSGKAGYGFEEEDGEEAAFGFWGCGKVEVGE